MSQAGYHGNHDEVYAANPVDRPCQAPAIEHVQPNQKVNGDMSVIGALPTNGEARADEDRVQTCDDKDHTDEGAVPPYVGDQPEPVEYPIEALGRSTQTIQDHILSKSLGDHSKIKRQRRKLLKEQVESSQEDDNQPQVHPKRLRKTVRPPERLF